MCFRDIGMVKLSSNNRGVSLIELIVTMTILAILAAMIFPSVQKSSQRMKEVELKRNLRMMRTAIDEFKKASDSVAIPPTKNGYPETLDQLVEGVEFGDNVKKETKKFLRRIPNDPFNPELKDGKPEWGLRSYTDKPDSTSWGGDDVYDIHSLSEATAIDGTKYKDW
jgi:general secretion pathway protein G